MTIFTRARTLVFAALTSCAVSGVSYAQQWDGSSNEKGIIWRPGIVGVGEGRSIGQEQAVLGVNPAALPVNSRIPGGAWWNTRWRYRTRVAVNGGGFQRTNKVANFPLNFTTILAGLDAAGSFNPQSVRVIEVSGTGTVLNQNVVFQFDRDPAFNAATNALGTVALQMSGTTAATQTRYYHIYFEGFTLPPFRDQLTIADNVSYQGQLSYQIDNRLGSLIYHKQGGGFASMTDLSNVEWIGYNDGVDSGAAGESRGIPNLGVAGHPGYTNATSTIISQGPIKITIKSQTNDGSNSAWFWDFYPTHATMTLTQAGSNYWFLYEGTPAGTLDEVNGYVKTSAGQNLNLGSSFAADLPDPEWASFGQTGQPRFIFVAHHENDGEIDHYRPFGGAMALFGFGRGAGGGSTDRFMSAVPQHMTFGFGENEAQAQIKVNDAYRDLPTSTGISEQNVTGPPTTTQQPANQKAVVGQAVHPSV